MPQQAPEPGDAVTLWLTVIICDGLRTPAALQTAHVSLRLLDGHQNTFPPQP